MGYEKKKTLQMGYEIKFKMFLNALLKVQQIDVLHYINEKF